MNPSRMSNSPDGPGGNFGNKKTQGNPLGFFISGTDPEPGQPGEAAAAWAAARPRMAASLRSLRRSLLPARPGWPGNLFHLVR